MEFFIDEDGNAHFKEEPIFILETSDWDDVRVQGVETKEDAENAIQMLEKTAEILRENLEEFDS
jgi:hypothetical protein